MSEPQAVRGLCSLPGTGTGSEESEELMEQGPEPRLAMLPSSAARRLEVPGDANDTSGIGQPLAVAVSGMKLPLQVIELPS